MTAQPKLDPRGMKRICSNCGNRFYDMNKRPIICPACSTEFDGVKVKSKRGAKASEEKAVSQVKKVTESDDSEDDIKANDDVISLDDAADLEKDNDEDDEDGAIELDDDDLENIDDLDDDLDDDDLDDLDADIKVSKDDD
mgnify:CR=1 FL=1